MTKIISIALGSLIFTACSTQESATRNIAFVSKKASEANLSFSHSVLLESAVRPSMAEAKEQISEQVQHLFGPMERSDAMAAPKEDHAIELKSSDIEKISDGLWKISYRYSGSIVLENGPRTKLKLLLPRNPDTIYKAGFVGGLNTCTDEHYQDEGDFWYFWSPAGWGKNDYPRCRLQEGKDYVSLTGTVLRLANDRSTYPEYDRLAVNKIIDAHFFYGMDEAKGTVNPYKSEDINAASYRDVVKSLSDKETGMGFSLRRWSKAEVEKIIPRDAASSDVYVEEAIKEYPNGLKLRVRIFFGQTGIDEKSTGFHYFFRDALKNSSVMIYNGHSGLGGHLDLKSIADLHGFRISPNKDRYQIYFFNSCTSYTYYNTAYFNRKRSKSSKRKMDPSGTMNLDIMANGLATAFEIMHDTDMALINVIDKYAARNTWTSYQKIARDIDSDNLFTINGDEDNPTSPRR